MKWNDYTSGAPAASRRLSVAETSTPTTPTPASTRELVITLFELGREVTSVLDLDELLAKIPQLIARMTNFTAFAVYLLDGQRGDLSIAYSVGYPEGWAREHRLKLG